MGLKGFFNKLAGNDPNKGATALVFMFGEDKRFFRRMMESTGVNFHDNPHRQSYDSFPGAVGTFLRKANGTTRNLGPVSIAYEPTSRLFSFPTLTWADDEHKTDVILDTAFAEGCGLAVQKEERAEWMSRLTTILLLAVMGAVILLLLIAAQSGQLTNVFAKLPQFFGR